MPQMLITPSAMAQATRVRSTSDLPRDQRRAQRDQHDGQGGFVRPERRWPSPFEMPRPTAPRAPPASARTQNAQITT